MAPNSASGCSEPVAPALVFRAHCGWPTERWQSRCVVPLPSDVVPLVRNSLTNAPVIAQWGTGRALGNDDRAGVDGHRTPGTLRCRHDRGQRPGAAHRRVKQKLLGAQRAGLSMVFIPQRNEPDLDDRPAEVVDALDVKPMADVADIVGQALEPTAKTVIVAAYPAANVT